MLKKILTSLVLVTVAMTCYGFIQPETKTYTINHVVRPGETLNGIADAYYDLNSPECVGSKDDYRLHIRVANNKLHNMDRQLQVRDVVAVEVKQLKK